MQIVVYAFSMYNNYFCESGGVSGQLREEDSGIMKWWSLIVSQSSEEDDYVFNKSEYFDPNLSSFYCSWYMGKEEKRKDKGVDNVAMWLASTKGHECISASTRIQAEQKSQAVNLIAWSSDYAKQGSRVSWRCVRLDPSWNLANT